MTLEARHPTPELVERVLDREASEPESLAVLTHLQGCEPCARRHGPAFELELWAPLLPEPSVLDPRTGPRQSRPLPLLRSGPALVAAAVLLVVGLRFLSGLPARWASEDLSASPPLSPSRPLPSAAAEGVERPLPPPLPHSGFRLAPSVRHRSSILVQRPDRRTELGTRESPEGDLDLVERVHAGGRFVIERRRPAALPTLAAGVPR